MSLLIREKMNIIRLAEIDSTNIYAKMNLAEYEDRTVICADKQTNGHGRFDRVWVDLGSENVFMSIVLKPSGSFQPVFTNITQYFSVVLAELLEEYGLDAQIKWPNDVLIDGKKIAGILCETVIQGSNFKGLVLGAGINLNASQEDVLRIKDKDATALNLEICNKLSSSADLSNLISYREDGCCVDKKVFLDKLLNKFFENYDEFLQEGFMMIKDKYVKKACFLNKEISVQVFNDKKTGFAKQITDFGELVLENDNREFILTMGDIL